MLYINVASTLLMYYLSIHSSKTILRIENLFVEIVRFLRKELSLSNQKISKLYISLNMFSGWGGREHCPRCPSCSRERNINNPSVHAARVFVTLDMPLFIHQKILERVAKIWTNRICTLSWRVTHYCVVEILNLLKISRACSTEKTLFRNSECYLISLQFWRNVSLTNYHNNHPFSRIKS